MEPDLDERYLREGIRAIKEVELDRVSRTIDTIIEENKDQLHFKGTAENFRNKVLEFSAVSLGGQKAILSFLNKNKYMNGALNWVDEQIQENPEEIKKLVQDIEKKLGRRLEDLGLDREVYERFKEVTQKKGLFGKESGMKVVSDALMDNLENVVEVLNLPELELMEMMVKNTGITVEGVKEAYKVGGFTGEKGVTQYITDKVIINGKPYIEELLEELEIKGINHGLTADQVIEMYKANGFIGRNGLVEKTAEVALDNIPGLDKVIYLMIINKAAESKKKELENQYKDEIEFASGFSIGYTGLSKDKEKILKSLVQQRVSKILEKGIPEELKQEKLLEICKTKGLYGNEGLLAYISQNAPSILANAYGAGLTNEKGIRDVSLWNKKLSNIKSIKDLFNEKSAYEKYAIALAKKAEELGVGVEEILTKEQYVPVNNEAKVDAYGSLQIAWSSYYGSVEKIVTLSGEALEKLKSDDGKDEAEKLISEIRKFMPKSFFDNALNAVLKKYVKKTFAERLEDYLVLTKALFEKELQKGKKELRTYVNA